MTFHWSRAVVLGWLVLTGLIVAYEFVDELQRVAEDAYAHRCDRRVHALVGDPKFPRMARDSLRDELRTASRMDR